MYRFCDNLQDDFTVTVEMYEKSELDYAQFCRIVSYLEEIQQIYDDVANKEEN